MSELKVTYASLDTAAADIRAAASDLRRQLDDLLSKVRRVANTWEGDTFQAFQATQNEWNRRAEHMQQVLNDVATRVQNASGSYAATDRKTSTYFDGGY
ncbi:hypothetical protein AQ490_02265 [Wenjunlia vitaminophila]|uniref:ESAT-6-like protein n=1 Tax=Wenjunlia vitaminophila TaxID=76728 RepID=A0A0T6LZ66_WENVI|nr:WXG100 family type VII secretion target [Wenjunlia vitaminophila]KRV51052.1 hypothetical protein AQ490_02265 [Wenjunlia vitaminophila]